MCAVIFTLICRFAKGVLTLGGTVTTNGVYANGTVSSYGCPANLIDGIFNYKPVTAKVCFPANNCATNGWLSVQLVKPANIETVLVINREETVVQDDIQFLDLYVGMTTTSLIACNANLRGTGLYSCGGRIGLHLRIKNGARTNTCVHAGEIRAYTMTPTASALLSIKMSAAASCNLAAENLFDWPVYGATTVVTLAFSTYQTCRNAVAQTNVTNPPYVQADFVHARYIHAVTILGLSTNNFAYSQQWRLSIKDASGAYTVYGQWATPGVDDFGKEVVIGASTTSIKIERIDGNELRLFWVGIFSSVTDCSNALDWSQSSSQTVQVTDSVTATDLIVRAQLGDCVVAHYLDLTATYPSYVTYNASTQTLSLLPSAGVNQQLSVSVVASTTYGSSFNQETRTTAVKVCTQKFTNVASPFAFVLLITGMNLTQPLPTITTLIPATITWTLESTAPNDFQIAGNNIVVSSNAAAGTYSFALVATDSVCQMTQSISTTVSLVTDHCYPIGFTLSQSSMSLEINSTTGNTLTWSKTPQDPSCGFYSVTADYSLVQVNGQTLTVVTTTVVNQPVTLTLTRDDGPAMKTTQALQVKVYECQPTGFALSQSSMSLEINSTTGNILSWSKTPQDPSCGSYSVTADYSLVHVNGQILTLVTTTVVNQSVTLTLTRDADPAMKTTQSLQIIISDCRTKPITFSKFPVLTEIKVGWDIQPYTLPFRVDEPCQETVFFSLSGNQPFLVSASSPTDVNNSLIISQATADMHGVYQITLTASTSTKSETTVIKISINGCLATAFIRQPVENVEIFRQSGTKTGNIIFNDFQHSFGLQGRDCGKTNYKVQLANNKPAPQWITLDADRKSIKYDISTIDSPQTFQFNLIASLEQYQTVKITESFNITVASSEIICNKLQPTKYILGDPPQLIAISYSNQTFTSSQTKLTKFILPTVKRGGAEVPLPKFIKYEDGKFTLQSNSLKDVGSYLLGQRIGYQELKNFQVLCEVPLSVKYIPQFSGEKVEDQKVSCESPWNFIIPEYMDFDQQPVQMTVDFGSASQFFNFEQSSRKITSDPAKLADLVQSFPINVTMTDSHASSSTFSFNLDVECVSQKENSTERSQTSYKPFQAPPPTPSIVSFSHSGLIKVRFTRKLLLPSYEEFPELQSVANCTDSCRKLKPENQTQQAIEIMNQARVKINGTVEPFLNLKIIPGVESNITQLAFDWKCVEMNPGDMSIQLNFSNADLVSFHSDRDSLALQFNGYQYLRSADGQTIPSQIVLSHSIPAQVDIKVGSKLNAVAQTVANASKAVVVLQFVLKLLLSLSLQTVFGAINKLQIMIHILLLNITVAPNALIFFSSLVSLVNFDLIDTEALSRKTFKLNNNQPFSDVFDEFGYSSNYIIINMGMLFYALIQFFVILALIPLLSKSENARILKLRNKLQDDLVWGGFIEYLNEAYLVICITCLIAYHDWRIKNVGEGVDKAVACAFAITIIGVPLFKLIFLLRNRHQLHEQEIKKKFKPLYIQLRFKGTRWALLEPFVTDLRRLAIALTVVLLQGYPTFQLMNTYYLIIAITIFNGQVEPYKEKGTQRLEQFNELTVLSVFYHLLCFADLVTDSNMRTNVGWSMVAAVSTCLGVNFGIVIYSMVRDLIEKFKHFLKKRKQAKHAARRRAIEEGRQKQLLQYYEDQRNEKFEAEKQQPTPVDEPLEVLSLSSFENQILQQQITNVLEKKRMEQELKMLTQAKFKMPVTMYDQLPKGFVSHSLSGENGLLQGTQRKIGLELQAQISQMHKQQSSVSMLMDCSINIVTYKSQPQYPERTMWKFDHAQA